MEILVVAATRMEIVPFLDHAGKTDILITGVGAPACLYSLTAALQQKKFDMVVQAGIAGTFRNSFPPGDTVLVKDDLFADLGIYEKNDFFTLFEKGFAAKDEMPYTAGRLLNPRASSYGLPAASAITINTVSDQSAQTAMYVKKYSPDIESMEGAAFHYVCISEGVPFIQLRSVSNFVGERIKTNWKMKEAVENLNAHLIRIINMLNKEKGE